MLTGTILSGYEEGMRFNHKLFKKERTSQFTLGMFVKELQRYEPTASKMLVRRWEMGSVPGGTYLILAAKILGKRPEYFFTDDVKKSK